MANYNRSKQKDNNGAGLFLILTFIFLSISIWQTAEGYQLMFGIQLSWIFSIAIGLMMLFLTFEMRKRRLKGISAIGPLIGYIACAIFCFFGNFNAIYSRYNRDELFKKELEKHRGELTAITTSAISALSNADSTSTTLERKILELKSQLIMQIKDPANAGVGKRSVEIINEIQDELGQKLTPFSGSPDQRAKSYSTNIENILTTRLKNSKKLKAEQLIFDIQKQKDSLDKEILLAVKPQNVSSQGQNVIFETVDAINNIGQKTKNFLGDKSFNYTESEFENQEIGKISQTFSSAFNGSNWSAAIISILVSIAIDALVPFVIFVGTKKDDEEFDYESGDTEKGVQIL